MVHDFTNVSHMRLSAPAEPYRCDFVNDNRYPGVNRHYCLKFSDPKTIPFVLNFLPAPAHIIKVFEPPSPLPYG